MARAFVIVLPAALLTAAAHAQTSPTPAAPPPPACESPEHRQFDFWVGRWDVYVTGTDQLAGRSLIERLYAGCAIRENWTSVRGGAGGSLNAWRPAERRWRQLWTDSSNGYDEYVGAMEQGAMVLTVTRTLPDGTTRLDRMRYTREPGGAVRQLGTSSTDDGATWQTQYDFTYRPAATSEATHSAR